MDGVLVVDKPSGPTSHDVVARTRRALGERRIGHTGTLDPLATGVLPLVIGRATRLARFLTASDKEYDAVVRLGVSTTTYDCEGDVVGAPSTAPFPDLHRIERALDTFRGTYDQQPPVFSARKIGGQRSYRLARAGDVATALPPTPVTVHRLELLDVHAPDLALRVVCSAGFYVRSLAHDLGIRLGTGAHLLSLRRTRCGDFGLATAVPLGEIDRVPQNARGAVVPLERLLTTWPAVVLSDEGRLCAIHGRDLGPRDTAGAAFTAAAHVRLLDQGGQLVGIAEPTPAGVLHPAVVFV